MKEIQAKLECTCGRSVVARAKDAGGSIVCSCGQPIAIPNLSTLRTLAGRDAYVTNPVEAIRKMQNDGNDPAGDKCLLCSTARPVIYRCTAVCEQSHVQKTGSDSDGIIRWFILPSFLNVLLSFQNRGSKFERRGHDIEVVFNLPLCELCATSTGNPTRSAVAKRLMQRVPVYKDLLEYYPALTLKIERG